VVSWLVGWRYDETDQNRGRSTVRAPSDLSAPPGADLRSGGPGESHLRAPTDPGVT
jgi:hypothetical protein